ncbi:hypothetical protein K438DRAFT_1800834 [Mycena galopus ATCC 62051]|nr:hypothetical protein K438DRAFT_1800834 [Mycena galopus ATCC 62051]
MYLPGSLSIPPYFILHEASYLFGEHAQAEEDYYTIIARWVSRIWVVIVTWFQESFAAIMKWAHDTIPVIMAWLGDASASASQPIKEHPKATLIVSGFIFLGPQVLLLPLIIMQAVFLLILTILGFGARGIVRDSPAASYQSLCYGGNTPASSLFAILQSIGMRYHTVTLGNWVLATIRLLVGVLFVYAALGMILWW